MSKVRVPFISFDSFQSKERQWLDRDGFHVRLVHQERLVAKRAVLDLQYRRGHISFGATVLH